MFRFARIAFHVGAVALVALAGSAGEAVAQTYPSKAVKIVVPFAPGGRVDGIARLLGHHMGEQLGQPFVVDNRAGAGGSIGSDYVAKAAPDGYTLLLNSAGTHAILPNVDKKLPYDSLKDFTPIANLVEGFTFVGANPALGVTDVAGLVKLAKEKPGTLGFATSGVGTYGHFAGELLKMSADIDLVHIAYKGSGPALNDISAGHVPLMVAGELVELAKAGKVRVLATTNERRWPELPDVKTMKEQGYPQFTVHSWIGMVGTRRNGSRYRGKAQRRSGQGDERSEGPGTTGEAGGPDQFLVARRLRRAHQGRSRRLRRDRCGRKAQVPVMHGRRAGANCRAFGGALAARV